MWCGWPNSKSTTPCYFQYWNQLIPLAGKRASERAYAGAAAAIIRYNKSKAATGRREQLSMFEVAWLDRERLDAVVRAT